jgi:sugar-specific transcriptional regulator TrmB
MNVNSSLEQIGLAQNEITVYLYLLANGESSGTKIYKETLLDKSATYKALAQLESKELVIKNGDARNQAYRVTSKEKLNELFEKRKAEIDTNQQSLLQVFENIEKQSTDYYQRENVQIFSGIDAQVNYQKELIKGDVTVIRSLESSVTAIKNTGSLKKLDELYNWFIKARVDKGIAMRVLKTPEKDSLIYQFSNATLLKECREYGQKMELPASMTIFGNRVGFHTLKNGKYWAIIITDELISRLLANIFDEMWRQSTIV